MLLLAAFLLVPIFFFLLARLVFVTRVLETIFNLLIFIFYKQFSNFRSHFLPKSSDFVKIFSTIVVSSLFLNTAFATTITLSKGQVTEIKGSNVNSFAIGNKEVISVKFNKVLNKFRVKGLMQGFSELKLWGSPHKTIKIYVLSKSQELKLRDLKQELTSIGLNKVTIKGRKILISGIIDSFSRYRLIKSFLHFNKDHILDDLKMTEELSREIIARVYKDFFNEFYDEVSCSTQGIYITCKTTNSILANSSFIKNIEKKYYVGFHSSNTFSNISNYLVEMRIIQIEKLNGTEINLGLSEINVNLKNFIKKGASSIAESGHITLKKSGINISTLATPKAIIKLNSPLEIKIGSEIPFSSAATNNSPSQVKWKFAGLNINLKVERENNQFLVNYKTALTRPIGQTSKGIQINGNRQKSSFSIALNRPVQIFEIGLKTNDKKEGSLPILGDIPILGNIFKSKSDVQTHKKIIAIVNISKKENL